MVATGWGKITNDRRQVLKVSCPKSFGKKDTDGGADQDWADCGEINGAFSEKYYLFIFRTLTNLMLDQMYY